MLPRFHLLDAGSAGIELPLSLNDPMDYVPSPVCRAAAAEVLAHLASHPELSGELAEGKMFGVLVVRDKEGRTGFLAAFSGNLAGTNDHPYFVPPVYDMLAADGFFRRGEAALAEINRRIEALRGSAEYAAAAAYLEKTMAEGSEKIAGLRRAMAASKLRRDARRAAVCDPAELERLDNESRREKSELRRAKAEVADMVSAAREAMAQLENEIEELVRERRQRSEELQRQIFANFEMVAADGERRNLLQIFEDAGLGLPPAGAGECAAPKLFQYGFLNGLEPVSIAEFWYGASPKGEVRRHGCYYPACRGKCKPILDFVLRDVQLERRPRGKAPEPDVIFEDDWIMVVGKPAGMLSVDGKIDCQSVEGWAKRRFSDICDPMVVHRLDMDVSGLLLIAKNLDIYRNLQKQFLRSTVKKRYVALVEGTSLPDEGRIGLPLRPDPLDRPRQVVDKQHGKRALTIFRVRERRTGVSLVELEPVTGRTHQLRVHAASTEGLNAPIVGDTLYGAEPASRLCLHNEYLAFDHPVTGIRMEFTFALPPESSF